MHEWTGIFVVEIAIVAEALAVACFLAIGAVVGSFLNVVAHRVPRGESVVFEGSHCPACNAKIRARDNVPVLGWLLLRGRCRDCNAAIAPRYPLVEAACAAVVGLIVSVELLSGGGNLPRSSPMVFGGGRRGIDVLLFHHDWRLFGICLFHCFLLVTLLAWALLAQDGHPVPRRWCRMAVVLAVVATLLWPTLLPVGLLQPMRSTGGQQGWQQSVAVAVAGLTTGWLVGRGLGIPVVRDGLALVGVVLGWQAVVQTTPLLLIVIVAIEALAAAIRAVHGGDPVFGGRGCRAWGAALLVATAVQILSWRWIEQGTAALWHWAAPS
jgi:leader peptidase (prepilin peptidase) / N-methyltransferase